MLKSNPNVKKCGNERGVSQYHSQLAALLHFVAQPPPLGCVVRDAPWVALNAVKFVPLILSLIQLMEIDMLKRRAQRL
jgi:hypothetical protein